MEEILGRQDFNKGNAKIMVHILVAGVGVDDREANWILLVFVDPGIETCDIGIFNDIRLFYFTMHGHSIGSTSIKCFPGIEGRNQLKLVQKGW